MKQGDVDWVDLNPPHRTEAEKIRPALIISIKEMNDHAPRVIVAPITSNIKKVYKSDMLIHSIGGRTKESKVMLNQIRGIDKGRLRDRLGQVDRPTLKAACELAIELIKPPSS